MNLNLQVEKEVVWRASLMTTLIPTSNTMVHVRRPDGKTDSLLLGRELRVGRAGDNKIILYDRTISRHHLKLTPAAGGVYLTNLSNHPNVTFLDGVTLAPHAEKKPLLVGLDQKIKLIDGTQITFEVSNMPA